MEEKSKQRVYRFSLSERDKHNRQARQIVDGLLKKGKGALSQSIRDGLRLLNDLRRGNTKVLLEMFPEIIEKLCPPEPPKDDIGELKEMIRQLQQKVEAKQAQVVYIPSDGTLPDNRPGGYISAPAEKLPQGSLANGFVPQLPTQDGDEDLTGLLNVVDVEPKEKSIKGTIFDVAAIDNMLENWGNGKNLTAEANELAIKNLRHYQ